MAINSIELAGESLAETSGSVMEMAAKLEEMKQKMQLIKQFFKKVMEKDIDYGIIPGTDKPTLYQPGADKIGNLYNFSKVIADKEENKEYATGHYDATVKVRLVHRASGVLVSEGEGSCSTRENKYHYRWVSERDVPKGIDLTTLLSKEYENRTTGAKWSKYRIENEDLFSLWNTVLKMAVKRAYIAAILSGTGLSGIFSQEEDELDAWIEGETAENDTVQGQQQNGNKINEKDLSVVVNFGQFKGKTLGYILDENPSYLKWLANNARADKVKNACANILNAADNQNQQETPVEAPPKSQPEQQAEASTNMAEERQYPPSPGDDDVPPPDLFNGDGGEPA